MKQTLATLILARWANDPNIAKPLHFLNNHLIFDPKEELRDSFG